MRPAINETVEYHLGELEIARTLDDPQRVMPILPNHFESLLDLGCGIGQTLIAGGLTSGAVVCGVDIDPEMLAFGKKLSPEVNFICAQGELLPFPDRTFEVVISRVALPFMHLPSALAEIARVAKPGGHVWFALHPFSMVAEQMQGAIRNGRLKHLIYQLYVAVNGVCFHLLGRQFRYPLNRSRCESFQTTAGVARAMSKVGFEQVKTEHEKFFVVTAKRSAEG